MGLSFHHPNTPGQTEKGLTKGGQACAFPFPSFSPIRTITVGSGITPDLLTLPVSGEALAGFAPCRVHP